MIEESFCLLGCEGAWRKREFFGWKAEAVDCYQAEFLPYGIHVELLESLVQLFCVDVLVVLVKEHCPVTYLTQAYAFCGHVSYSVVQDDECVVCRVGQTDVGAVVVPCS